MFRLLTHVLAVVLFVVPCCEARVIYVNNLTGSDRYDGSSKDITSTRGGPFATINKAMMLAHSSDVIEIANTGSPYREPLLVTRSSLSGSNAYPFRVEGNGAELRGTRRLPPEVWKHLGDGVFRYQPFRKGHYQLFVDDVVADEVSLTDATSFPPELEPKQWMAWRGFVYFRVEPGKYIADYAIETPYHDIGVAVHGIHNVHLLNLKLRGFRLDGIHVSGVSRNVRLEHIESTGNGRAGIVVTGASKVLAGGLKFQGNRKSEQIVPDHARLEEIPAEDMTPPLTPMSWDRPSRRVVRLELRPRSSVPVAQSQPKPSSDGWIPSRRKSR